MTEMVKKIALAIAPAAWVAYRKIGTGGDSIAQENRRKASLKHARAALETMRKPTEAMLRAGENATRSNLDTNIYCGWMLEDKEISELAAAVFSAMIDEVLK